jgi:hypothetical protein
MSRPMTFRQRFLPASLLLFAAMLLAALAGCNDKVTSNPNDPPVYPWRIELRVPAVMYRNEVGGNVPNYTIPVRVYNTAGDLQAGVVVSCWSLISPQKVSPQVTTVADTVANPWGSDQPLYYWGTGSTNPNVSEVITAKASLHGDTVAAAQFSFLIKDPPSLQLLCPDILYRDATGAVPHDTIKVRAFSSDGTILNNITVHFSCLFSPDSITQLATTFSDTTARPWGTVNPVTYWGSGPPDPSGSEQVTATAVIDGGTVTAVTFFHVLFP